MSVSSCCKYYISFFLNYAISGNRSLISFTTRNSEKVYEEGCGMKFEQWLEGHVTLAGGFIIGIAVLQLLSIVIACCFARKRQNTNV